MRIFLISSILFLFASSGQAQCEHPDYEGLMMMYVSLDGNNWIDNTGWQEASMGIACDPCSFNGAPWYGVHCENERVICLDLDGNPECSASIGLNNNSVSELSDWELTSLETLHLGNTNISGELIGFTGMPNLKKLSISWTNLSGSIPNFKHMPNLENLNLYRNRLTGEVPDFNSMPKLKSLNLGVNILTGGIPELKELPLLETLDLSINQLTDTIPDFNHLESLTELDVSFNKLNGCYSFRFCDIDFSAVGNVDVASGIGHDIYCGENCIVPGCTPSSKEQDEYLELRKLYFAINGEVSTLQFGWNPFFSECSHCDWEGVTCENGRVVCIDLDGTPDCQLAGSDGFLFTGYLPELHFEQLQHLFLDGNNISGTLPSFDGVPELETLVLSNNRFKGPLPDFDNNTRLKQVRMSFNQFEGSIPDYSHLNDLDVLSVSFNNLSGCYYQELCDINVFHAVNNPQMPWGGDHQNYCNGVEQIGAPCNVPDNDIEEEFIQEFCYCSDMVSSTNNLDFKLSVFPNPVTSHLFIDSDLSDLKYSMYNVDGLLVKKGFHNDVSINIESLIKGIYILEIKSGIKSQLYQVVKI